MDRWSFEPVLDSYGIVVAICAVLALVLVSIRPWSDAGHGGRPRILMALRGLLIAMLGVAMLRPSHISTQSEPQSATLIVLFDQSRSMTVQDLAAGQSRWQRMVKTLQSASEPLQRLSDLLEVRAYGFDQSLAPSSYDEGRWRLPAAPEGQQTDLAAALHEAMQREAGKRLAAVILLTDGGQRVYQPQYDVQQTVRELTRMNTPLYTVPLGKPRDQSQARDVAIEKLNDQFTVFVKNELEIRGALRVQGYVNRAVPVRIDVESPDGRTRRTLGPNQVTATLDDQLVDFQFAFTPDQAGSYKLIVEAEPQEGELVVSNNRMTAYVNALDGGIRILYVEGNLVSPEQQMLRRSLAASPDIELMYRPIDPRRRSQWPIDLSDVFQGPPLDVVLIGDVDATALGDENLQRIADNVMTNGRGLMMTGGINTLGPGGYRGTPVDPLLPVELGQFNRQEFGSDKPVRADLHVTGPLRMVPTPGRPHFITQLAPGAENQLVWRRLKPLLGANRLDRLRPTAMRLAETETGEPLLVARQFAPGRVLVFAGDSTHRWWRWGQQDAHQRFWRQAIMWLANQDEILRRDVWAQLDRRRFRPGESVMFRAGAKDATGEPIADAEITAKLQVGDQLPQRVTISRQGDEWVGEVTSLTEPGEYQLQVEATVEGQRVGQAVAKFQVEQIDLELTDPAANPQLLAMLSSLTQAAGGRSLPPEQLNNLLAEIQSRPPEMKIEVQSKWRFGDTKTDTWPFFIVFVALLGTEWFLRKKWGDA